MANTTIQLKKSSTPAATPTSLANGELAINFADGKLFYKDTSGTIQEISGGGGGGNSFGTVNAYGTLVIADTTNDVLSLLQGNNIIITGDAINDRITFDADLTAANNWANTKLANTTGVTFEGNLRIKTDLSIGNNITNVTSVIFNTSTNRATDVAGELTWSDDDSTLRINMDSPSSVVGHIGQDQFYYVKNQTGSAITKGTVVRFAGTLGSSGRLLIAPAIANNSLPSKYVIGVTAANINDGDDGFVLSQGKIRQIDTSMFSEGDILYVSPSTAGAFSNTLPSAPNNKITVAAVVKKDSTQGVIEVRVTLGSKLNEDELVEIDGLTSGDIIEYVTANSRFENTQKLVNVYGVANSALDKANSANVLAYNTGIGANGYAVTVGDSANNYAGVMANSVNAYTTATYATQTTVATNATSANNYAGAMANASNAYAATVGTSANTYASGVGISANAYSDTLLVTSRAYTNTSTDSANNHAGVMANAANSYAASLTPDLSPAFSKANGAYTVANAAFDKANTTSSDLANTAAAANNYAGAMANSSNAYTVTVGVAGNTFAETIVNANLITARAYTNTSTTAANNYAGVMANSANAYADTKLANTTNTVFSGNLITSGVVRSTGLQDSTGRLLLIKDSAGTVVWGN